MAKAWLPPAQQSVEQARRNRGIIERAQPVLQSAEPDE